MEAERVAAVAAILLGLHLVVSLGQQASPSAGDGVRLVSMEDLAGLYSLRGSLGLRARDWPRKTDPCANWTGVECIAGRVVGLRLSGLRRTRLGRLTPSFAVDGLRNLTTLEVFNSTGFLLPGPIPDWFGFGLAGTVDTLDLRDSGIRGNLPSSIGSLLRLRRLSLSGNRLTGSIPSTIAGLTNLTTLDLSRNEFTGRLPPSVGEIFSLTLLDLSSNFLSGSLPSQLGTLTMLKTLILSNNNFAGSVPALLGELSSLLVLDLSTNRFSGSLPSSIWALSDLELLDLSSNNLNGTFPEFAVNATTSNAVFNLSHNFYYGTLPSGTRDLVRRLGFLDISSNYFQGGLPFNGTNYSVLNNCFTDDLSDQRSVADCTEFYARTGMVYQGATTNETVSPGNGNNSTEKTNNRRLIYILSGAIGGSLLLLLLILLILLICLKKKRRRRRNQPRQVATATATISSRRMNVPTPSSRPPTLNFSAVGDSFTYDLLLKATSGFSDENLIKRGHSGDLYHGVFESGTTVVVKKVDLTTIKMEKYLVELDFFARASHTRLVPLLGHCLENENEKFLVYKYMKNRDLSTVFYRKSGREGEGLQSIDWITRSKIAIGVAEALCYLHHECVPPLVHRDIQASSILLDDKFEVRLGSLSEVCTQEGDGRQNVVTRLLRLSHSAEASTSGSCPATCAYDVYCFGKVLLELVTGKLGISGSNEDTTNEWLDQTMPYINIYERELLTKILDPSLVVDEDLMEEVWAMAIVAKSCLNSKPTRRPPVKYILKALENPLKVVREEASSNSARLRATSSRGSWNAALFGSWRMSSDIASASGPPKEMSILRPGTVGSQGSGGENSFNRKRLSKDIFPEPSYHSHDTED